jgi:hypothetical protein
MAAGAQLAGRCAYFGNPGSSGCFLFPLSTVSGNYYHDYYNWQTNTLSMRCFLWSSLLEQKLEALHLLVPSWQVHAPDLATLDLPVFSLFLSVEQVAIISPPRKSMIIVTTTQVHNRSRSQPPKFTTTRVRNHPTSQPPKFTTTPVHNHPSSQPLKDTTTQVHISTFF